MSAAPQNTNEKRKRRYLTRKTLGRGAFGTVYLAEEEGTNQVYAVKETFQDARYKNREAGILKTVCKHPAIITVYQMFYTSKKDGKYLNIVMEYMPMSLHDLIQKCALQRQSLPESDIAYYGLQLIRACSHIWRLNICHRDIKPQNIVCDPSSKQIRLCDFGSAKQLNDGEWNKHYICSRFYRAPELLCQLNYYSCAVDCWSVGCVLAEMYLGQPLFGGNNTKHQLKLISKVLGPVPSAKYPDPKTFAATPEYKISPQQWQQRLASNGYQPGVSAHGADFIRNLVCYIPTQRFDLSTLSCLKHPFVTEFVQSAQSTTAAPKAKLNTYPTLQFIENEADLL